ncbi:GDYXXLXY domain-containing protein [bacterium]|nr:GDYXXLXY domain-containing protein [bacterium]MCP5462893.1 GDYXXLXY domain-containing protein [bacterium]
MNSKKLFIALGLYWLIIISSIFAFNQYILLTGTQVLLRTVPIDPRSLFRGDYVALSYEISRINLDSISFEYNDFTALELNEPVCVSLKIENGYAYPERISSKPPQNSLFIKGTISTRTNDFIEVAYGIETFFVPEGQGKEIEQKMGKALDVKASIDRYGNAVIHSLMSENKPVVFTSP